MGTKRTFRPFIGFAAHDVPSTSGDRQAVAVGVPGATVARSSQPFGCARSATERRVVVRFRSFRSGFEIGCCLRQRRQWSSASSELGRVSVLQRARRLRCRRPPQGGRWASASRLGLRWRRWPSGRPRCLRLLVRSELASDVRHGWRGSGNILVRLDGVSGERTRSFGRA
jgi:hypothetical protein